MQATKTFTVSINARLFSEAIASVMYAVSKDACKASLTCVYVFADKATGLIQFASTDGHRLATYSVECSTDSFEVLIPGKELRKINTLLKKTQKADVLQLSVGADTATFTVEGKILESVTLPELQYPEYKRLIPRESSHSLICDRMALVNCLKESKAGCPEKDYILAQLKVNSPEQTISISVGRGGEYHAAGSVGVKTKDDTTLIVLDRRYLLEALTAIASKEVEIKASPGKERCPITISTFEKTKTAEAIALIMPARIWL